MKPKSKNSRRQFGPARDLPRCPLRMNDGRCTYRLIRGFTPTTCEVDESCRTNLESLKSINSESGAPPAGKNLFDQVSSWTPTKR